MQHQALSLIQRLPIGDTVIPVQELGELFTVLVRKAKRKPGRAQASVLSWQDAFATAETSLVVMVNAMDLTAKHGLSIWDSVIVSAAADANCRLLLSEDLQDGFTWRGVSVTNPFADALHPLQSVAPNAERKVTQGIFAPLDASIRHAQRAVSQENLLHRWCLFAHRIVFSEVDRVKLGSDHQRFKTG